MPAAMKCPPLAPDRLRLSVLTVALALAVGVADGLAYYLGTWWEGRSMPLADAMDMVPSWLFLVLLVPVPVFLSQRLRLGSSAGARRWLVHLVASMTFAIVALLVAAWNYLALTGPEETSFRQAFAYLFRIEFVFYMFIYWTVAGAVHAWHYHREALSRARNEAALRGRLSVARLEALRHQLNPHFLFNTLNGISTVAMKGEREKVVDMLGRLADLLRLSLDEGIAAEIPLHRELELADAYLEIARQRFADRLTIERDVAEDCRAGLVPSLILQPLLENALHHGIGARPGPGRLGIRVRRQGDRLRLEVSDTGPGFSASSAARNGGGVGLWNSRERLEQLYGERFELAHAPAVGGGVVVRLTLPFHTRPADSHWESVAEVTP